MHFICCLAALWTFRSFQRKGKQLQAINAYSDPFLNSVQFCLYPVIFCFFLQRFVLFTFYYFVYLCRLLFCLPCTILFIPADCCFVYTDPCNILFPQQSNALCIKIPATICCLLPRCFLFLLYVQFITGHLKRKYFTSFTMI